MASGRAFQTLKEANAFLKKRQARNTIHPEEAVRKMSKKVHPRRKNLFHVGTKIDFLNFA